MEKKAGLILGGIFLFSLVLVVGVAMALTTTQATTATVTVNTFLSVTIDDTTLAFEGEDPLATSKPLLDPLVATIGSESNINADVKTKADEPSFLCLSGGCSVGVDNIPISNLDWDFDVTFPGVDYTETAATVCPSLSAGNTCSIFHELTIPASQAAGAYDLAITISVVALV